MSKTHNLFISHSWSYSNSYNRLTSMLTERPYFFYKDFSVPKDDPIHNAPNQQLLFEAIRRKIQPCHVVVIMSGVYSTYSKWINKEIHIAMREFSIRKPILGIVPWGAQRTSTIVTNSADLIVGWNTESIVNGIRQLS